MLNSLNNMELSVLKYMKLLEKKKKKIFVLTST